MSKRWWLLALGLVACSDTVIGSSKCEERAGEPCSDDDPYRKVLLPVHFTDVSTADPAELPIKWRIELPCAERPCSTPIQLFRAGSDGAWTLPREGVQPALGLIDPSSLLTIRAVGPAPANSGGLQQLSLSSDELGRAVVHAQWLSANDKASGPDSIYVLPAAGFNEPGPWPAGILGPSLFAQIRPRLPLGTLSVPNGMLFIDGTPVGGGQASLFAANGKRVFSTPAFATLDGVGTSAAKLSNGYVLGAGTGTTTSNPDYGMLAVDSEGGFVRYAAVDSSTWRSVRVQRWAAGEYAAAAQADVNLVGTLQGAGEGNIEVVTFTDPDMPRGYRVERSCEYKLTLNGFTSDARGTVYISSVSGKPMEPRGLLCRLPVQRPGDADGIGRCWQAPPNMLLWELSASDSGALYAVMGPYDGTLTHGADGIVRIELPPLPP